MIGRRGATVAIATLLITGACAAVSEQRPQPEARAGGARTLTVFAAASLKTTFTALAEQLERNQPGTDVRFNFAGSSDLVTQLQAGAPADVFAAADTKNMDRATADALVRGPAVPFASNTLQIAVPPDNPAQITGFADLDKPGVNLVVCAPAVPCGSATEKVEKATGVTLAPVSEESSVTDVLNKVVSGEADAGLVYVTDVRAVGDEVIGISFPEAGEAENTYPIAVLQDAPQPDLAREFVELVTGPTGQHVLANAGFGKP